MGAPTFTIEKKLTVADDAWPQVGQQIPVRYLPEDQDRCEIDERALEMTRSQIVTPRRPARRPRPVAKPVEKLSALHKQGVLTDEEFQAAKAKVLGEL